jgi:hypothetical protein
MNTAERVTCCYCGSADLRWVTSLLAVWDGTVLRCSCCDRLKIVPNVARAS